MLKWLAGFALIAQLTMAQAAIAAPKPDPIAAALGNPDRSEKDRAQDANRHADAVLTFAQLKPGQRVLDVFAGGGYFSELIARVVGPKGLVIAYNNPTYKDGTMALRTERGAGTKRLPNVSVMVADAPALGLPTASFDRALFSLSYHDVYWVSAKENWPAIDKSRFLRQIFQALRPGGKAVVIDHVANPGDPVRSVDTLHRIDPAVIREDFEAAGFVFDGESDALRNPADDHSKPMWDDSVRGKTDRILWRFRKP